jgi:hypothetical protein
MSTFNYKLHMGAILLGCLLMWVVLGAAFFGLFIIRAHDLGAIDFSACAYQPGFLEYYSCLNQRAESFFFSGPWQAVQFVCYVFLAALVGGLTAWLARSARLFNCAIMAFIAAAIAGAVFNPGGGVVGVGALFGGVLGGLIAHSIIRRHSSSH